MKNARRSSDPRAFNNVRGILNNHYDPSTDDGFADRVVRIPAAQPFRPVSPDSTERTKASATVELSTVGASREDAGVLLPRLGEHRRTSCIERRRKPAVLNRDVQAGSGGLAFNEIDDFVRTPGDVLTDLFGDRGGVISGDDIHQPNVELGVSRQIAPRRLIERHRHPDLRLDERPDPREHLVL